MTFQEDNLVRATTKLLGWLTVALILNTCGRLITQNGHSGQAAIDRYVTEPTWRGNPDAAQLAELRPALTNPSLIPIDTTLGEWRRLGPRNFTGKVYDIAVSAQTPDKLYAAYGAGGVWRFTGAGANLLELTQTAGANRSWNQVAVWAGDDNTVVIGSGALWYSAGFCLATRHTTSVRVLSAPSYGTTGASDLRLRILDSQQNTVVAVPSG